MLCRKHLVVSKFTRHKSDRDNDYDRIEVVPFCQSCQQRYFSHFYKVALALFVLVSLFCVVGITLREEE